MFFRQNKGHFLFIVGCLINEGRVHGVITLEQNILPIGCQENGVPRVQGQEIFILRQEVLVRGEEYTVQSLTAHVIITPPLQTGVTKAVLIGIQN